MNGNSQFPNYFGEVTLWTGLATTAAGVLLGVNRGVAGQFTALALPFISPAFTAFVLLKVSGVPLSEAKYNKRYGDRKDYQDYKKNTPKFFPKVF